MVRFCSHGQILRWFAQFVYKNKKDIIKAISWIFQKCSVVSATHTPFLKFSTLTLYTCNSYVILLTPYLAHHIPKVTVVGSLTVPKEFPVRWVQLGKPKSFMSVPEISPSLLSSVKHFWSVYPSINSFCSC